MELRKLTASPAFQSTLKACLTSKGENMIKIQCRITHSWITMGEAEDMDEAAGILSEWLSSESDWHSEHEHRFSE